jgi:hypothetical protein
MLEPVRSSFRRDVHCANAATSQSTEDNSLHTIESVSSAGSCESAFPRHAHSLTPWLLPQARVWRYGSPASPVAIAAIPLLPQPVPSKRRSQRQGHKFTARNSSPLSPSCLFCERVSSVSARPWGPKTFRSPTGVIWVHCRSTVSTSWSQKIMQRCTEHPTPFVAQPIFNSPTGRRSVLPRGCQVCHVQLQQAVNSPPITERNADPLQDSCTSAWGRQLRGERRAVLCKQPRPCVRVNSPAARHCLHHWQPSSVRRAAPHDVPPLAGHLSTGSDPAQQVLVPCRGADHDLPQDVAGQVVERWDSNWHSNCKGCLRLVGRSARCDHSARLLDHLVLRHSRPSSRVFSRLTTVLKIHRSL